MQGDFIEEFKNKISPPPSPQKKSNFIAMQINNDWGESIYTIRMLVRKQNQDHGNTCTH